jgi:hypothetical protein
MLWIETARRGKGMAHNSTDLFPEKLLVVASNGKAMVPNITAGKLFGSQINA